MRERWGEKKKNINFLVFCLALKTRTAIQETNNFSGYRPAPNGGVQKVPKTERYMQKKKKKSINREKDGLKLVHKRTRHNTSKKSRHCQVCSPA
jgi:hypothetical protein